jgi:hypothetical protein
VKTLQPHPFAPGDKVRLVPSKSPLNRYHAAQFWGASWNHNDVPRHGLIYSVRHAFAASGMHAILVSGIHSLLKGENGGEWGFDANLFERVNRSREHCPTPSFDDLLPVQAEVPVPPEIARLLRFMKIPQWIGTHLEIDPDGGLEAATRRWTKKNPHQGIGIPFQEHHRRISEAVAAGGSETVPVMLSDHWIEGLEAIADSLEIDPYDWLQAVLGHLAQRVANAHRLDAKSARNGVR